MLTIESFTNQLVDYAGLFPPAGLDMPAVVENYAQYLAGPNHPMLARLIVPAGRLAEFEELAASLLPTSNAKATWRISALVPPNEENKSDFKFAISGITQFNERHAKPANGLALVDVIEVKTPTLDHIRRTIDDLPVELSAFMEIPHAEDPSEHIRLIANSRDSHRFFAKIRTGGVTPDLIPPCDQVARFIHSCAEQFVGFKATAGLHHPIRGDFKLTYEPDSATGTMHGFVNVFTAACFAFAYSMPVKDLEKILAATSADEFSFTNECLRWRDYEISPAKVAAVRSKFAISFGSCSFTEPTEELQQTGVTKQTVDSTP